MLVLTVVALVVLAKGLVLVVEMYRKVPTKKMGLRPWLLLLMMLLLLLLVLLLVVHKRLLTPCIVML